MKRKISILLFALSLIVILTACGEDNMGGTSNQNSTNQNNGISSITSSLVPDSSLTPSGNNSFNSQTANENQSITEQRAKEIALEHAGLKAEDITAYTIELDRDMGTAHYDIDFKSAGYEYDYEINAESGKIIKSEKEIED